jgi:hypothetical protein
MLLDPNGTVLWPSALLPHARTVPPARASGTDPTRAHTKSSAGGKRKRRWLLAQTIEIGPQFDLD